MALCKVDKMILMSLAARALACDEIIERTKVLLGASISYLDARCALEALVALGFACGEFRYGLERFYITEAGRIYLTKNEPI